MTGERDFLNYKQQTKFLLMAVSDVCILPWRIRVRNDGLNIHHHAPISLVLRLYDDPDIRDDDILISLLDAASIEKTRWIWGTERSTVIGNSNKRMPA